MRLEAKEKKQFEGSETNLCFSRHEDHLETDTQETFHEAQVPSEERKEWIQ